MCTHLDSKNHETRRLQVVALTERLAAAQASTPTVPIVLAGDFNISPQTTDHSGADAGVQYHHLVTAAGRVGLVDVFPAADSVPTHKGETLDHVFLDPQRHWAVVDKRYVRIVNDAGLTASDHLGIGVELRRLTADAVKDSEPSRRSPR